MSLPNMQNSIMTAPNMIMNQVPMNHQIITQNNGVVTTGMAHQNQIIEQNNLAETQQLTNAPMHNTAQKQIQNAHGHNSIESMQVLTKQRLQDLVRETDQTLNLEDEVEEIILGYVDEFVDRCLNGAALIAKNRHGNTIEVKDVQQFLNRNYNMWTPGFGTDELKPYKRSLTTEAHKQRTALIRKTLKKY